MKKKKNKKKYRYHLGIFILSMLIFSNLNVDNLENSKITTIPEEIKCDLDDEIPEFLNSITAKPNYAGLVGILTNSTFFGGNDDDYVSSVVVDDYGCTYIVGTTYSTLFFPTSLNAFDDSHNGIADAFCCKISADGSSLIYSTLLGGSKIDIGRGIDVDNEGNAYIVGITYSSSDFPTTSGVFDDSHNGESDIFISKISPSGDKIQYSTFIGGSSYDTAVSIVIDDQKCAYVTGYSVNASDFPTTVNAINETSNGEVEAFVCKISPDGSTLEYSTLIGAEADDRSHDIDVDPSGNAYIVGYTNSINFSTTPGCINKDDNHQSDAFICKISADGTSLIYSNLIGGSQSEAGYAIVVDNLGCAYIAGHTTSRGELFPTTSGAYNRNYNGGETDAFVSKISADGTSFEYSTLFGGEELDVPFDIAINSSGCAYITGYTFSKEDFPVSNNAISEKNNGQEDAFICIINAQGTDLEYSTYIGGEGSDIGTGIAVNSDGEIIMIGTTNNGTNFPITPGIFGNSVIGEEDAFICRIKLEPESESGSLLGVYIGIIGLLSVIGVGIYYGIKQKSKIKSPKFPSDTEIVLKKM